jgi:hypothetical protein
MPLYHYFLLIFIVVFSCKKEKIESDLYQNGVTYVGVDKKQIAYTQAGIYFIKRELKDTTYTKRAVNQIPSVEVGSDGELYCAWYANSSTKSFNGEGSGAYVVVSVSTDKGETWRENELVIGPINNSDRIFDECLWTDPFGQVHLFWSRSRNSWWDGKGELWECTLKFKKTGYIRTSEPRLFAESGLMLNKPIALKETNIILYPQYLYYWEPSIKWGIAGMNVYSGTFNKTNIDIPINNGMIPFLPNNLKSAFLEPQFLQIDKNTIACYIRIDAEGIYFSKATLSSNLKDWTPFVKLPAIGENISMRFCVRRLISGNILFVTCNDKNRKNMTAYLSTDNGNTFPYKLLVDGRSEISYPDFTQDKDGNIFITYDRERTKAKEILIAKIRELDIMQNDQKAVKLKKVNLY